jgi:hypothetical protein
MSRAEDPAWRLHLHRPEKQPSAATRARLPERPARREVGSGEQTPMKGKASAKVLELIERLEAEGQL